ncbi:MAG: phage portal protein [Actinomycetota bacterium]
MNVLDRILAERAVRSFPVGLEIQSFETDHGHRDEFAPPSYGDYLATSNDIYSVVNFRARHIGSLPLLAFEGRGPEKQLVESGPEPDLLRRVNPFWTFSRLMRQTEMSMGVWGESFWAVEKDARGEPIELWWRRSTKVHPVPSASGWLGGFIYESGTGERLPFATDEIIWFRYPNPLDEWAGLPPLVAARLAADVASASMKSNRNLFAQGMQMGGVVMPKGDRVTFSADQAEELERSLARRFKGVDKAHRWGVLRFEADIQNLAVTPKDAEFVAGLNLTFRQVCRVYGVPSPLLYDLEHATLANLRELQLAFWQDCAVPEARFYADDLEEQLLPMFRRGRVDHLAWDFAGIPSLQEATTAVWDRERQAIDVGALTINEWRKSKGMPPVAWGDVAWMAVNKAPVSDGIATVAADGDGRGVLAATIIADELKDLLSDLSPARSNGDG